LGRSVAVDSPTGRLVASSRHFGDEDSVRIQVVLGRQLDPDAASYLRSFGIMDAVDPMTIPPRPELGMQGRICYPLRSRGLLLGFLWLIDDPVNDPGGVARRATPALEAYLPRVAVALEEQSWLSHRTGRAVEALREVLCGDVTEPPEDLFVSSPMRHDHHVRVFVATHPDALIQLNKEPLLSVSGRTVRVVVATAAARLQTATTAAQDRGRVPVAASSLGTPDRLRAMVTEAFLAAVAVTAFAAPPSALAPGVAWDDLGALTLLLRYANDHPDEAATSALIERLSQGGSTMPWETAEVFLDLGGDRTAAAKALYIHRSTLHYRLSQLEKLTGLDLSSGLDRLTIHTAIKLDRIVRTGLLPFRQAEEFWAENR
jgi:hypothetical protein